LANIIVDNDMVTLCQQRRRRILHTRTPWQKWQNIYDAEKGFCNGTIFQELNLPFFGVGGCQNGK
jgi:hypothetical protein